MQVDFDDTYALVLDKVQRERLETILDALDCLDYTVMYDGHNGDREATFANRCVR